MAEKTFEKGVSAPQLELDGSGLRIAIVRTRWNHTLVENLYKCVFDTLTKKYGVLAENIVSVSMMAVRKRQRLTFSCRIQCPALMNSPWLPNS